jgi:hypothetical protein
LQALLHTCVYAFFRGANCRILNRSSGATEYILCVSS